MNTEYLKSLPNFMIVGAPKCGTTSMVYYLRQHPEIFCSAIKEPNFFSSEEVSLLYYKSPIIRTLPQYKKLFANANNHKVRLEASTSYLFYPNVSTRIYSLLGYPKFLIMLRDPVKRAHSHYLMDLTMGCVNTSFGEIIRDQKRYPIHFQQYVELGLYYNQIQRYLSIFGSENVKILTTEQLRANTETIMREMCEFLQIEPFEFDLSKMENTFKQVRMKPLSKLINSKLYLYYGHSMPTGLKRIMKKILFINSSERPSLRNEDEIYLRAYFANDIDKLKSLLGIQFN